MDFEFKVKSIRMCRPKKKNTLAYATVCFPMFGNFRFRIAQDEKHDMPTVYPLRHGEGGNRLFNTFSLNKPLMERIGKEVLARYFLKLNTKREKPDYRIISFPLRLLFHFYTKEKNSFTTFRIWFVCRYLVDQKGNGFASLPEVAKLVNLKPEYVARKCRTSNLFSGLHKQKIYFVSLIKVLSSRKRNSSRFGLYRQEKLTKIFLDNLRSNKKFAGYICKVYMEKDLVKSKKYTHGRISLDTLADELEASPRTIWSNLKAVKVKKNKNIHYYPQTEIKGKYEEWLLPHMDLRPDRSFPQAIESSPNSYFSKTKDGKTFLARRFPDVYTFTGFSQTFKKFKRGNAN